MTPNDVYANAKVLLQDASAVTWLDTEKLLWINDCLDAVLRLRGDLFGKTGNHTCTAGAEQTATFARCVSINSVDQVVGGGSILPTLKPVLDSFKPAWRSDTAGAAVHWMPHDASPTKFWLYPPAAITQSVVVNYTEAPAALTQATDTIPLHDGWLPAVTNYVLFRCFSKDAEQANNAALAASYYAAFEGFAKG